jgi:hypothetical protein
MLRLVATISLHDASNPRIPSAHRFIRVYNSNHFVFNLVIPRVPQHLELFLQLFFLSPSSQQS